MTFGNKLYSIVQDAVGQLLVQGEMAQLTYMAYEQMTYWINSQKDPTIAISIPIGYNPDRTPLMGKPQNYSKQQLQEKYAVLGHEKMPIDGIFQLVTITESMLNDIIREILKEFPKKISGKRKLDFETVLSCDSIEQIKLNLVDTILNESSYKSPKEYAEDFKHYSGVNLLESPIYHQYIELKATRDIHTHNMGIANDIYLSKAGVHARVQHGDYLSVDIQYFLEKYESCLQLTEFLEAELNNVWSSSEYEINMKQRKQ